MTNFRSRTVRTKGRVDVTCTQYTLTEQYCVKPSLPVAWTHTAKVASAEFLLNSVHLPWSGKNFMDVRPIFFIPHLFYRCGLWQQSYCEICSHTFLNFTAACLWLHKLQISHQWTCPTVECEVTVGLMSTDFTMFLPERLTYIFQNRTV